MKLSAGLALFFAISAPPGAAQPAMERAATAACAKAKKGINMLADFASTDCAPTKDGAAYSLLFVTTQRVFDLEQRATHYKIIVTAAAGEALNKAPGLSVSRIIVMDRHLGEKRTAWQLPAETAKRLQAQISRDKISMPTFLAGINAAEKIEPVSRGK